jgi:ActR/RegA family two-component response regulator
MLNEEKRWIIETIKTEVAEAIKNINIPTPIIPKPVDVDEIVKLVLDKIKIMSASAETPIPIKRGKKED